MKDSILIALLILSVLQIFSSAQTTTYRPDTTTYGTTTTARPTSVRTYSTSNWYQLSSQPSTNTLSTTISTPINTDTTTRSYETTTVTPWPTRQTTRRYTDSSRTTESTDRTNYGTQSTHSWYDTTTTTATPSSTPEYTTRGTSTYPPTTTYYTPETTTSSHTTHEWYTTTMRQTSTRSYPAQNFEKLISVQPFRYLKIRLARNVALRPTTNFNDHYVKFLCPTSTMDFVVSESHDGTLSITAPSVCDLEIQSYQFERLDIGSVQNVWPVGDLHGNRLSIVTGGQGALYLTSINYDAVDVMMFGQYPVVLAGSARILDVTQLGTGYFDSRYLISDTVQVFSRNSGSIYVKSTNILSLFTSESANIIWCSPQIEVKSDVSNEYNRPNISQNCE